MLPFFIYTEVHSMDYGRTVTVNSAIRKHMKESRVPIWLLASEMGISENTLSRMLRCQLTPSKKAKIEQALAAIEKADKEAGLI